MKHSILIDSNSNGAQRYLTHSVFRYFGKYPPTSTRMLLEKLWEKGAQGPVVDVMCGSGTTVLESLLAGKPAIGIDVNPVSVLVTQVKTEQADPERSGAMLRAVQRFANEHFGKTFELQRTLFSNCDEVSIARCRRDVTAVRESVMENVGRWFSDTAAMQHAVLRTAIDALPESAERRAIQLAWLRTIRKSSKASGRTGRLFLDKQKSPRLPFEIFVDEFTAIQAAQSELPRFKQQCEVIQGSAMNLSRVAKRIQTVFWHPPYFALYKYSSDVLRLELEWLGVDRRDLAATEIRDGFKTSNPEDSEKYLADCQIVWSQMFDACVSGARGVAINSDSTLAKKTLNIFRRFADSASDAGFQIEEIYRRETTGTQAQYHRSADSEIQTKFDYIVFVKKP